MSSMQSNLPDSQWGHFHKSTPARIDEVRAGSPVAYLPWGALEWHSYHNPVGLDGLVAVGLCEALAARCGGLVLPPIYAASSTIKNLFPFPHNFEYSIDLLAALCRETLEQCREAGFSMVVLLSVHCGEPHLQTLKKVAEEVSGNGFEVWALTEVECLNGEMPANHAARGETSLQLALQSELVQLDRLPQDRVTTLEKDGVWGEDPRRATAQEGNRIISAFVENAAPLLQARLSAMQQQRSQS